MQFHSKHVLFWFEENCKYTDDNIVSEGTSVLIINVSQKSVLKSYPIMDPLVLYVNWQ